MLARVTQAEQLAAQAASWQAAGRPDMAVQLYTAALDQDPAKYAIRMQLAECLVYLGQVEQAAEQYLMLAQAYAARGRHQECLAICERILHVAPQTFVYMSVGPMIRRIGRHARPLCAKAAELHLGAGRQTDGLQILRLGAELDPHNPDVRRTLARIYLSRHMKREAVEALVDAGTLLVQAKRHDDYVEVAKQILELAPQDIDTLRELPRVYLELSRPHEAVRALGALTKASPGDIAGYEILAQAFAVIGRTDKALSVIERLVEQLGATGQQDKADAILNHAKYWRPTDIGFLHSLKKIEIPRTKPATPSAPPPPPRAEGTVVLNIADLMIDERSIKSPSPTREDSAVHLVEVEGTSILNLDDLMMEEEPAAAAVTTPDPPPPPGGGKRPPPDDSDGSTVSLDGSMLRAAIVAEASKAPASPPTQDRPTLRDMPAVVDEGPVTESLEPNTQAHSISSLIYDDEEEEEAEPATQLHIKPLTAEDIARAQREQAAAEAESKTPPFGGPTAARPSPPPPHAPAPVQPAAPQPQAQGEEAPTMANLRPVTAADIARSLSRQGDGAVSSDDDAPTLPPMSRPTPPPPAPAPAPAEEEEDEATRLHMGALTAEDIARELARQRGESDSE